MEVPLELTYLMEEPEQPHQRYPALLWEGLSLGPALAKGNSSNKGHQVIPLQPSLCPRQPCKHSSASYTL